MLKKLLQTLVRKPLFSVVNNLKIRGLFYDFAQSNIKFITFLWKSNAGAIFYAILLALYFFRLLGGVASSILAFALFYILIIGFLLFFSVNLPPLRKRMNAFFGEGFISKYLEN